MQPGLSVMTRHTQWTLRAWAASPERCTELFGPILRGLYASGRKRKAGGRFDDEKYGEAADYAFGQLLSQNRLDVDLPLAIKLGLRSALKYLQRENAKSRTQRLRLCEGLGAVELTEKYDQLLTPAAYTRVIRNARTLVVATDSVEEHALRRLEGPPPPTESQEKRWMLPSLRSFIARTSDGTAHDLELRRTLLSLVRPENRKQVAAELGLTFHPAATTVAGRKREKARHRQVRHRARERNEAAWNAALVMAAASSNPTELQRKAFDRALRLHRDNELPRLAVPHAA